MTEKKLGVAKIQESISMQPQVFFFWKREKNSTSIKVHYRTGANEEQAPFRWTFLSGYLHIVRLWTLK